VREKEMRHAETEIEEVSFSLKEDDIRGGAQQGWIE
jgi:hypothetical protein